MRLFLFFGFLLGSSEAKVALRHLSTEYLPIAYGDSSETFEYNKNVAEQMAFDSSKNYIYVVGVQLLQIIDFSDPENLRRVNHFQFPDKGEATDVETCGDLVAVSYDNQDQPLEGKVFIFKSYNGTHIEVPQVITVGAVPDMVEFTHDCGRLLVAIEGELRMVSGQVTDPEGEVVIITLTDGTAEPSLTRLDFKKFNIVEDGYIAKGVRRVWRGENSNITTTFSQDLEPESIEINDDDTRAYVVLQENNAVAVIDLTAPKILDIYPLGQKQWLQQTMDPSDEDGGIMLGHWDIYSLYQPDGIKLVTIGRTQYLLTADEGDRKNYKKEDYGFTWSDDLRGKEFVSSYLLHDSVSEEMKNDLNDDAKLGISIVDGKVSLTGTINTLYTLGGRSFSLYDVADFTQAYTSDDLLEVEIASRFPKVFNSNPGASDQTPEEAADRRSDKKGPEPNSVDYAELQLSGNEVKRLIFLGLERPGMIGIFQVTDEFPGKGGIVMENLQYSGGYGHTYEELWRDRVSRDLAPQDIKVLPTKKSPIDKPLLAVAGTVSGTLSLYEIYEDNGGQSGNHGEDSGGLSKHASVGLIFSFTILLTLNVLALLYCYCKRKQIRFVNIGDERAELTSASYT